MNSEERKLSIILFADIVGYTSMMQNNEPSALFMLKEFKGILEDYVPVHEGTIVQYFGDACLLSFQSPTRALNCALKLQQKFLDKEIPVRVGMHSGDVVFSENNAFGDTVNLASRIESISIPGAILMSKSIRDQVKSNPEFKLLSLGNFEFKNVEEPVEVFALSNDHLKVPTRNNIKGKLKAKSNKWTISVLGILVILIGIFIWQFSSKKEIISNEIKEKKLAVVTFDNQTNNQELNAFGTMISDWVTNRLMETGEANIINFANVKNKIRASELEALPNPDLSVRTGVNLILNGRYYELENNLMIVANLVEVETGKVIKTFEVSSNNEKSRSDLVAEISNEVLDYWAVRDVGRYANDPPKYEAYKEYQNAVSTSISDPFYSENTFKKAFQLDTGFYSPLFSLLGLYNEMGRDSSKQELLDFLESKKAGFTKWEKLRLSEWKAINELDWIQAAKVAESRFEMDPSDFSAVSVATICYGRANRPFKALELKQKLDSRYLPEMQEISWNYATQMFYNLQAGKMAAVDSIAETYDKEKIPDALGAIHLFSLAHLKNFEKLEEKFNYYKEMELYNSSGQKVPKSLNGVLIINELYLLDEKEQLEKYIDITEKLIAEQPEWPSYNSHMGFISFYKNDFKKAIEFWNKEDNSSSHWPGWIANLLPLDHASRLGVAYANAGMDNKVEEQLAIIDDFPTSGNKDLHGAKMYYKARILSHIDRKTEAMDAIEAAFRNGFHFFGPERYGYDPFLKPLADNQKFQSFLNPGRPN